MIVRAFMAHHQGMSLVALDNLLNRNVMQNRFHDDPLVQATELLLQERVPRGVAAAHPRAEEVLTGRVVRVLTGLVTRAYDIGRPAHAAHAVALERNLQRHDYLGRRRLFNLWTDAVTRWREDTTRDNWGALIYVRDVRSSAVWSTGHQPVGAKPQKYEVAFSEDKADFLAARFRRGHAHGSNRIS